MIRIVVDAMGGDNAPGEIVRGALIAAEDPSLEVILVGRQQELADFEINQENVEVVHADNVIGMNDSAVARDASSSIAVGVGLVREGRGQAFISAGHTGACMTQSVLGLKRLPGIIRPAIPTPIPVGDGYFLLVDAGANVDCKPEHLVQFAVMGEIYVRQIMGVENPRVGLLSNGSERKKGNHLTQETYDALEKTSLNFIGYVEGNSIFDNQADVVVCDGFTGNVVLKTCEGLAGRLLGMVRDELLAHDMSETDAHNFLRSIRRRMDYSEYGGAPLLGISGTSIICHGSSKAKAIANAVRLAAEVHRKDVNGIIQREIARYS